MKIEIDQSGKVEKTSVKTVIADSLGNNVVVSSKDKRFVQNLYRKAGKPRMFVYELFSLLVAHLIKQSFTKNNLYIIDIEYFHKDDLLTQLIFQFLKKLKIYAEKEQIIFSRIGRKSKAHTEAYLRYLGKRKAKVFSITQILKILLH